MPAFRLALRTRRTDAPLQLLRPWRGCSGQVNLDELDAWLKSSESCRAVLVAFSADFFEGDDGKIFALDTDQNVGTSLWWLAMLNSSETKRARRFDDPSRMQFITDEEGDPTWVPGKRFAESQDLDFDRYELRTIPGLEIDVYQYDFNMNDNHHMEDDAAVARLHSLLKFAKTGAGRAVLAAFRVFEEADYQAEFSDKWHDAPPSLNNPDGDVKALVTVLPTSVFRLSDVLKQLHDDECDPVKRITGDHAELRRQLYEMTIFVARKVRTAADAGCFKLDLTASDIVFSPILVECESDSDKLIETGFRFGGRQGKPFIDASNIDFTKHGLVAEDGDCAYFAMMVAMLASVRAEYGGEWSSVMMRKLRSQQLEGKPIFGNDSSEDDFKYDLEKVVKRIKDKNRWRAFAGMIQTMLPAFVVGHKISYEAALAEAADDFRDLVSLNAFDATTRWTNARFRELGRDARWPLSRHVFEKMTGLATHRSTVSTAIFASPYQIEDEEVGRNDAEIRKLIKEREARLRRVNTI